MSPAPVYRLEFVREDLEVTPGKLRQRHEAARLPIEAGNLGREIGLG